MIQPTAYNHMGAPILMVLHSHTVTIITYSVPGSVEMMQYMLMYYS